jgi:predicted enzyme related to lactoylglutathione lyase
LYRVILPVSDIDVAARFYGHVFQDEGERVSPRRHYFDCNGGILACYSPTADGDDLGKGWSFHENQYLYFSVPDLQVVRNRIEEAGGHNLTERCAARTIIVTTFARAGYLRRALEVGASAYVLKTKLARELADVVRRVH